MPIANRKATKTVSETGSARREHKRGDGSPAIRNKLDHPKGKVKTATRRRRRDYLVGKGFSKADAAELTAGETNAEHVDSIVEYLSGLPRA
jgi:hypothetical protein